jgi:hypothetical protein
VFGGIIQFILREREVDLSNKDDNDTKSSKDIDDDYRYSYKDENEEEDEGDDSNQRDKDKERKKEYIKNVRKKVRDKIGKKGDETWDNRTSERNLNRETGGMEVDYDQVRKIELEYRSKKRKLYRKFCEERNIRVVKLGKLKGLRLMSLGFLKKRLAVLRTKKMFRGLLTKAQIKTVARKSVINTKKIKVLKARIAFSNKQIKKRARGQQEKQKQQENVAAVNKYVENYRIQKEQKKKKGSFIRKI